MESLEALGLIAPQERKAIPGNGPQTAASILDPILGADPEREALVGRHGRYSYAALDLAANRAASALAELGVGSGDRVAACLPNDVHLPIAYLATQRLGAIWVGINRVLAPPEKAYLLRDSGTRVYLTLEDLTGELAAERDELPELEHVIGLRPDGPDCPWEARCAAASQARPRVEIDPFAPAAIAYTSGTTGYPKGAVHSQHNLLLPGAVSHAQAQFTGARHGSVLALTILNLVVLDLLAAWYDGRCVVCVDRIDPLGLAEWIRKERIASFWGVPTIFHDLLTHPDVTPADLESLVQPGMGGSDVPPELVELYRKRFGGSVRVGYGMTEAPTSVTGSDGETPPGPGLCGKPLVQVEVDVIDDDGAVLAPGEVGEITVRAAEDGAFAGVYTPMLGYWRKPEATREALRGGRYHTGDLGTYGDDGNLYIRGRRNELILRGGANVYPAEVERVLQEHEGVGSAAVLGIADERLGERVVAVVEPAPGASAASEEALRAHCRERLARYKVPDRIAATAEMPRNAMGKIVKRRLEALFEDGDGG